MQEVAPGLWWWTAAHPDWSPDDLEGGEGWEEIVACYALVTGGSLLLFDPLVEDWDPIDRLAAEHGPPAVLLTLFWHARSAQHVLDRYDGASIWAHEPAAEWIAERTRYTHTFNAGNDLPGGVEAIAMPRVKEVAYWLPEHDSVVVGDTILRHGDRASLFPPSWARHDQQIIDTAVQVVRELMTRRPKRLLLTHGGPMDPSALEV